MLPGYQFANSIANNTVQRVLKQHAVYKFRSSARRSFMADVLFTRRADDRVSNNDQLAPLVIDYTASFVSPHTRTLQVADIVYMNAVGCYSDHGDS